ncbi:hypothetical protein ACFWUP_09220 [Nocardia sp. NPDC058658]|uniref:hypothetical protein n=1 Tax=Nocardia sp. NPDC058658 TaxID=3346580 RepID=UPI00364DEC1D
MGAGDEVTVSPRVREDTCGVTQLDLAIDDQHLYLDREGARSLFLLLGNIPEIAEDLADARTRQTRFGTADVRVHGGSTVSKLPFNPAAARVDDHLHAVLVSWVRLVCEPRALVYDGTPGIAGMARWLQRNIVAVAMTEGVEAALPEISAAVDAAVMVICPPTESMAVDAELLARAQAVRLNATGIHTLATQLGGAFVTLTTRRLRTLRAAGLVAPVPGPWALDWPELFVVGEVMAAHLALPARQRMRKA